MKIVRNQSSFRILFPFLSSAHNHLRLALRPRKVACDQIMSDKVTLNIIGLRLVHLEIKLQLKMQRQLAVYFWSF